MVRIYKPQGKNKDFQPWKGIESEKKRKLRRRGSKNHETMREDVVVYLGFDLERSKNTSRSSKSRNLAEE